MITGSCCYCATVQPPEDQMISTVLLRRVLLCVATLGNACRHREPSMRSPEHRSAPIWRLDPVASKYELKLIHLSMLSDSKSNLPRER